MTSLKRSLEVSNDSSNNEESNNLLSHLLEEYNSINENENSNNNNKIKVIGVINTENEEDDDEESNRFQKRRKLVNINKITNTNISPPKPQFSEQPQQQQQPIISNNMPFNTPRKNENNNYFKSFTPHKSRFSISSPINNNISNSNNSFLIRSTTKKSIKTQIENIHIPESPFNIKLKNNKIIPLKSLSQTHLNLETSTKKVTTTTTATTTTTTKNEDEEDEDDIDKKYFTENDLKTAKQFLDTELVHNNINGNNSKIEGIKDSNGIIDNSFTLKQQMYHGRPELVILEPEEESSLPFIPIDFSIKTSIQFISSTTFDWCGRAFKTPSIRSNSLKIFNNSNNNNNFSINNNNILNNNDIGRDNLFIKSLIYYSHPQSIQLPWDIEVPVLLHEEYKHQWMKQRWLSWYESFDSLYSNFREGLINYFYLINGQEFSLLFLSDNLISGQKVIMNQSSPRIRSLLTREKIIWQTPFINSQLFDNENGDASINNKKDVDKSNINFVKKTVDPAYYQTSLSSSQLVVQGSDNIDKLCKLLKKKLIWSSDASLRQQDTTSYGNNGISSSQPSMPSTSSSNSSSSSQQSLSKLMFTPKKSRSMDNVTMLSTKEGDVDEDDEDDTFMIHCKDVPQLLSKQNFIGSTVQINKVVSCCPFTKSFETSKTQLETAFKIDIEGPILPDTQYDLLKLYSNGFNDFQCKQISLPITYGFNYNNNNKDSSKNNELIEKSSKLFERNVIEKINFINKTFQITPIG